MKTFTRPSRSGGVTHVIHLDAVTLAPIDMEHPCSCKAGAEGRYCWAFLEVMAFELPKIDQAPEVLQVARDALAVLNGRAAKSFPNDRRN